jgi:peroxiredoxin
MKRNTRSLVFAAAIAAALMATSVLAVETGQPAPDFTLTDIQGKSHALSQYRGRPVVIEWVNAGCPVVKRHYDSQNMQATQKAAAADGAVWLQINTSQRGGQGNMSDAEAAAWLKKQGATVTAYLHDRSERVGRLYGAKATPHLYVIDAEGVLVYQGAIDDNPSAKAAETLKSHNYVKAALAALKAGRPVERGTTQAYGCGIKYSRSDT